MSALIDKIKSRGHMNLRIYPEVFEQSRVPYAELEALVDQSKIQVAGWEFPHIGRGTEVLRGKDWFGSESQWEHRLESFRMYESGLFVDIRAFGWDWRDESHFWPKTDEWRPDDAISVADTVHLFVETYLFAARLAKRTAGDDALIITGELAKLKGRQLIVDARRVAFFERKRTEMDVYPFEERLSSSALTAQARDLALNQAVHFFERFGWQTKPESLSELITGL